jgi:hypothetical protein
MDQARPHSAKRRRKDDRALPDWPACSSTDTIRWRLRADPGQKRDTGDRTSAQRRLTAEGPLQKKGRVVRLPAGRRAGRGPPGRDRRLGKPHGQTSALTEGGVILLPVRDPMPLSGDVVTAVLVDLERHGRSPGSRKKPSFYPTQLPPASKRPGPCNKAARREKRREKSSGSILGTSVVSAIQRSRPVIAKHRAVEPRVHVRPRAFPGRASRAADCAAAQVPHTLHRKA